MRTPQFFALIAVVLGASLTQAQTPLPPTTPATPVTPIPVAGLSRADVDKKAYQVAYDTVKLGADLFNAGNQEGCLRLYEGVLYTLSQFLDHRLDLVKTINDKMAKAHAATKVSDKAFALREGLDAVLAIGAAAAPAPANPAVVVVPGGKKPLWDRLGGQKAVEAVVHDFVVLAAGDAKVNITRGGKYKLDDKGVANLEKLIVEMISQSTGGPLKYTGRDMKKTHEGMKITDAEFDAAATDLIFVLSKYKVPKAEMDELLAIVGSTRDDIVEVKK